MNFSDLFPFTEAVQSHRVRVVVPTSMGTAELREVDAATRRQSLFSAKTIHEELLEQYKADVESLINPRTEQRADRVTADNPQGNVTVGYDDATARLRAKELLQKLGYSPDPELRGTLQDLSSDRRINLVLKTNKQLAQGAGNFIQGNDPDVLEAFPAQELVRFEGKLKQRNWQERWLVAANFSGDTDAARVLQESGRMVARKDSPIWDALGSSDLFDDGLDNPYPPFAFNSGMWVQDVAFDDAKELGIPLDTLPEPQVLDFENLFNLEEAA